MSQPEVVQAYVNLSTYISGFIPTFNNPVSHLMTISDGTCLDSTGYIQMSVDTGGVGTVLNNQINGLNGLAPGETLLNDTQYYIYLEWDPTFQNPAGFIITTEPSVPFMLSGYGYYRRVGLASTNSGGNFNYMYVYGNGDSKYYQYDIRQMVLNGGNATAFEPIDLSARVPAFNTSVSFQVVFIPADADDAVTFGNVLSTSTANQFVINAPVMAISNKTQFISGVSVLSGIPQISYQVSASGDSLDLYVYGYQDYL